MLASIFAALRGLVGSPWVHGVVRGIAEAAAFVVLYSVADFIAAGGLPDAFGQFGPLALLLVRPIEGILDGIDPAKQRSDPPA